MNDTADRVAGAAPRPENGGRALEWVAAAVALATCLGFFWTRVFDYDFWWHIATARHVWETGSLPQADPFGVYPTEAIASRTHLVGSWLGQLALFGAFGAGEFTGVIALKAALMTGALALGLLRTRMLGGSVAVACAVAAVCVPTLLIFNAERPQLFSFFWASAIFLCLDGYLQSRRLAWLLAVPPIALLWANMHPGILLGIVLAGVLLAGDWLERRHARVGHWRASAAGAGALAAMAIASLLTPSGLDPLHTVASLEDHVLRAVIHEYKSPIELWKYLGPYWAYIGLSAVAVFGLLRHGRWAPVFLMLAAVLVSITAVRYIPFLLLVTMPYVAAGLSWLVPERWSRQRGAALMAVIAASLALLAWGAQSGRVFQRGYETILYPVEAATLIKDAGVRGRLFNFYEWGGFLLWQLKGDPAPFVDGRVLDPDRMVAYLQMLQGPEGRESFDAAGFDLVLMPFSNQIPLVRYLRASPAWRPVHSDGRAVLFVRAGSAADRR